MVELTIDGRPVSVPVGTTLLAAARAAGVEIPTLCHDDRLVTTGGCRLCAVEVDGTARPVTACNTPAGPGMIVRTSTSELEAMRRDLLGLLASEYPATALADDPSLPFHRLLRRYDVRPGGREKRGAFRDDTHPYLVADFSRCIDCMRCVRICDEVQGQFVWRVYGRGADQRIRPAGAATLLESDCVSCGACADTCPTGAVRDRVSAPGEPEHWVRTTCAYCGVGCELEAGARDGRVVRVRPVADAPVNHGHLCVKGRYAFGYTHAPDRLTLPRLRTASGWHEIPWDEAIGWLAGRLRDIRDRHGPDSLAMLGSARGTNEENYLAQKFARVVLGTNNVDGCARVCHAPTATGMAATLGTGAATNSFADIELARTLFVFGANPTENHPVVGARLKQAARRGAGLIVADPRVTELARMADIHLQLRPGTNVALLNGLAAAVVEDGLWDRDMVRDRLAGWDGYLRFLADWSPERAAAICGVPSDRIRAAARMLATARPAYSVHGLGATEHVQGTDGVIALVQLALITGNVGRPGAGVNPLRGQNNVQGSAHMGCEPAHLTGYVTLEHGVDTFARLWGTEIPGRPGLNLMEMVDAAADGRLRALWAIGYDIAHTNPNRTVTRAALTRLELVVVQDLFENELAREFAHLLLPAASAFEKDGTFMNGERRVQRVRQVVPPPGEARSDLWILCAVARAMGHGDAFAFQSAAEVWDEVRRVWSAGAGLSYERLEHGGLQWPCPADDHPGTGILHAAGFPVGPRVALQEVTYRASSEETTPEFPLMMVTGRTLYAFNAATMTGRTPNAGFHPADRLDLHPDDARRIGVREGDRVRVRSRHGEADLPVRVCPDVVPGCAFTTFHMAGQGVNAVTGDGRDPQSGTPEYKVVAVAVERLG